LACPMGPMLDAVTAVGPEADHPPTGAARPQVTQSGPGKYVQIYRASDIANDCSLQCIEERFSLFVSMLRGDCCACWRRTTHCESSNGWRMLSRRSLKIASSKRSGGWAGQKASADLHQMSCPDLL